MSRIARVPVAIAKGVDVQVAADKITVKGPLGTLTQPTTSRVAVKVADGQVNFDATDESREANAMSGTMRALVAGMVQGVSKGFEKRLALVGVGYRAQAQGDKLNLSLGYSHPIVQRLQRVLTAKWYLRVHHHDSPRRRLRTHRKLVKQPLELRPLQRSRHEVAQ